MDFSRISLLDCHFSVLCIMAFTSPRMMDMQFRLIPWLSISPHAWNYAKYFEPLRHKKAYISIFLQIKFWMLVSDRDYEDMRYDVRFQCHAFKIQRGGGADIMHLPSLRDIEKINHFCGAWKRLNSDNMHGLCIKLCLLPAFDKIWKMKCQCMQNCGFLKAWKGGCFKCNINSRFNNFAR